jgi:hypothetical protein
LRTLTGKKHSNSPTIAYGFIFRPRTRGLPRTNYNGHLARKALCSSFRR